MRAGESNLGGRSEISLQNSLYESKPRGSCTPLVHVTLRVPIAHRNPAAVAQRKWQPARTPECELMSQILRGRSEISLQRSLCESKPRGSCTPLAHVTMRAPVAHRSPAVHAIIDVVNANCHIWLWGGEKFHSALAQSLHFKQGSMQAHASMTALSCSF